jgi:hypothetical protein
MNSLLFSRHVLNYLQKGTFLIKFIQEQIFDFHFLHAAFFIYGLDQDSFTTLKLVFFHFAVPKANEVLYSWSSLLIGSDPSSTNDVTSDRVPKIKSWSKTSKNLLTAKQFPAADILAATRDFNEECLIGEGFTGRVYRGDFSDGQVWIINMTLLLSSVVALLESSIIVCH